MGFHGDHVVTGLQRRCGDEDLGLGGGGSGEVGRGVGAGRVADRAGTHAGAVHLDAVDVNDGAIVGQVLDVDALEGLRVSHLEVRAVVGRHGARALGGDLGRDRGVAVAQRCCAGRPRGVIERGLGPVLGGGAGFGAVVPRRVRFEQDRVGGVGLAGGRSGVDRGGCGAVALGVDGAHEVAVLAAARHLDTGGLGGGDRTIVAQNLVGHGVSDTLPGEGHGGIVRRRGAQERGRLGRDVVAVVVASEAAVPLGAGGIGVGEGEVAAHPQVAVVIGRQRPGAGLAERRKLKGGPLQALAGGGVPRTDPLDLVDARPGAVHRPDVHVLVGSIGAVARTVDNALGGDGRSLEVATVAEGHGAGDALVGGSVVAEQGVLGAADVDAVARRGDGLLILTGSGAGRHEVEVRVHGRTRLRGELGGVPGALITVRSGEVTARVESAVRLGNANSLNGTADLGVPRTVRARIEANAAGVTGVDLGAATAGEVGEGAAHVDIAVVVGQGAHAHGAAAQRVGDLQVPRGVDLAGRGVDDNGTGVGLAVDAGEVTADKETAVGQGEEGLDLRIKIEGLAGEVAGGHIEGREAARGDLGTLIPLLDAGKVTTHVHGGADLGKSLDLDVAFLHGTVEITAHAPRGLGCVLRDGTGDRRTTEALIRDASEGRRVRGDARTHVSLGVGEDRQARLAEVGGRRGDVTGPVGGESTVAPPHLPARGASRGVGLQTVPLVVVAGQAPHEAGAPATLVQLDVDRVGHLEGPHEVGHLRELKIHGLVGAARCAPGAHDAHAVSLVLHRLIIKQLGDGLVGQLDDLEVIGGARARGQLRRITLATAPGFPSFAAAADQDPAATICRLVTKELGGVIHRGSLKPVGAVRSLRIPLLNVPARRGGSRSARTVANDSLTGCRISLTCTNSVSRRSERDGSTGDNRRSCKDCKARNRRSHDTTFRRERKLVA